MDEYIDREAATNVACNILWKMNNLSMNNLSTSVMAKALNSIPAADVVPVRHGRWVDKGEYAVCTECGGRSGTQYDGVELIPLMTQFCPNCGAKMDGGANND